MGLYHERRDFQGKVNSYLALIRRHPAYGRRSDLLDWGATQDGGLEDEEGPQAWPPLMVTESKTRRICTQERWRRNLRPGDCRPPRQDRCFHQPLSRQKSRPKSPASGTAACACKATVGLLLGYCYNHSSRAASSASSFSRSLRHASCMARCSCSVSSQSLPVRA